MIVGRAGQHQPVVEAQVAVRSGEANRARPAGAGGFWLLAGGTAIGWLAMMAGSSDWLEIARGDEARKLRDATWHAAINGLVLGGFTVLALREWESYPAIMPEGRMLVVEGGLIALLFVGNYFGGQVVWRGRGSNER